MISRYFLDTFETSRYFSREIVLCQQCHFSLMCFATGRFETGHFATGRFETGHFATGRFETGSFEMTGFKTHCRLFDLSGNYRNSGSRYHQFSRKVSRKYRYFCDQKSLDTFSRNVSINFSRKYRESIDKIYREISRYFFEKFLEKIFGKFLEAVSKPHTVLICRNVKFLFLMRFRV